MTLLCEILFVIFAVSWIGLMGVFMYFMIRYKEAMKVSMIYMDKFTDSLKDEPYPFGTADKTTDEELII